MGVGAVVVGAVVVGVVVGVVVVGVVVAGGMEAVVVVAEPVAALSVADLSVSVETTEEGVESTTEGTGILVVAEAAPEDASISEAGAEVSVGKISEIEGPICRCQSSHQISSSVS